MPSQYSYIVANHYGGNYGWKVEDKPFHEKMTEMLQKGWTPVGGPVQYNDNTGSLCLLQAFMK